MKKHILLILEVIIVTVLTTIACYGSYLSHQYSMTTEQPTNRIVYYPILVERTVSVVEEPVEVEEEVEEEAFCLNLTERECELLEQIAMAESGNQDTKGKALVMRVVLNRAELHDMSIEDVIFAPNQFYTAGMCAGDEGCHEALAMILEGWDESEGALYFCSKGWNYYGDTHLFKYGGHWFSK